MESLFLSRNFVVEGTGDSSPKADGRERSIVSHLPVPSTVRELSSSFKLYLEVVNSSLQSKYFWSKSAGDVRMDIFFYYDRR